MKIKCTNASTCSVAADTDSSFLIYDYDGTTLSPITSKLYYDKTSTTKKLYSCDANGSCSVAADKTYHLSTSNSNATADTIVTVASGTATPGVNGKYYYLTTTNSNESADALFKITDDNGAATKETVTGTDPKYYYLTGGNSGNSNLPDSTNYLISVSAAGAVAKETSSATKYYYLTATDSPLLTGDAVQLISVDTSGAAKSPTEDTKYYYLTPTDSPILVSPTTQLISVTTEGAATQAPALAYYLDSTNS
ncbi:hypothetical protein LY90DRAFT_439879, partial [Neocallimastix californiae]